MAQSFSDGPYAKWAHPAGAFEIEYSQPLFLELEYLVGEGYRRIPHGGIEIGGLLFGRITGTMTRIQEFRPIECEHAFGPSFQLSERDLARIREQMASEEKDPELAELQVVGWFVAHTRSELLMNDGEVAVFEELFKGAGHVTLLIKPEKFKATRFAFLQRDAGGAFERNGQPNTFILPLPGRAGAGEAKPSGRRSEQTDEPVKTPEPRTEPETIPTLQRTIALRELSTVDESTNRLPVQSESVPPASVAATQELQQVAAFDIPPRRRARRLEAPPAAVPADSRPSPVQFAIVLLIAAALGCAVGYWAYLQLPAEVIALTVQDRQLGPLITWPSDQTRDAVYAAIRVDDGAPVLLSTEDRNAGTTSLPGNRESVKVELIVRHWLRDSRGIVRYIKGVRSDVSAAAAVQKSIHPRFSSTAP